MLEAIAGQDDRDATTSGGERVQAGKARSVKGLRVGVVRPDYGKKPQRSRKQRLSLRLPWTCCADWALS